MHIMSVMTEYISGARRGCRICFCVSHRSPFPCPCALINAPVVLREQAGEYIARMPLRPLCALHNWGCGLNDFGAASGEMSTSKMFLWILDCVVVYEYLNTRLAKQLAKPSREPVWHLWNMQERSFM